VRYATNKGFRTGLFVGFGYGCVANLPDTGLGRSWTQATEMA